MKVIRILVVLVGIMAIPIVADEPQPKNNVEVTKQGNRVRQLCSLDCGEEKNKYPPKSNRK